MKPFVATFNRTPIPITPPTVNSLGVMSVFAPKEIKKVVEMKITVAENSDIKKIYREIVKTIKDFEKFD